MVLDGAQSGGVRSAMRHAGFVSAAALVQAGVPSGRRLVPAERDPGPDRRRTSRATRAPRSSRRCPTATSTRSARPASACGATTTRTERPKTFASEVVAADLNRDGRPELVFGTYGAHRRVGPADRPLGAPASCSTRSGCRTRASDGNGIGVPAAPSIGDLDGDGTLEIVLTTFDHGLDVFHVPGSGTELPAVADRPRQPTAQRLGFAERPPEGRR